MGNVFASGITSSNTSMLGVPPPPPSPAISVGGSGKDSSGAFNSSESKDLQPIEPDVNPGTIEDLHKKCKDVFPVNFEGAKLMVNKGLSNHFQISHTLNMSSVTPSGYRFGATFVGTNQISPTEAYPVFLGDVDASGNLNANIIHQIRNIRTKFAAQVQDNRYTATQLTADYKGYDFTASVTVGNLDILNKSGVIVMHYLQSVTQNISLGSELAYQYGQQVPGGEIAILSLAGRYTGSNYTVSGTLSGAGAHVCYYHKGGENLHVGVEVETNLRLAESVCSIGYQIDLPKANLVFRGMVDSNWTVGAVLEKKLQPLPFTFALSGMLNHAKHQFRFGCGLIIG